MPSQPPRVRSGVPTECVTLSEAFEGFVGSPYQDSAGVWTIGIGSTRDISGKPVTRATPAVSREQAQAMAMRDLERAAALMADDFPAGLPPRWWAAGVLMCNNMGKMSVWGPTLRAFLLANDYRAAAFQMRQYRNAGGKPALGLRRRRWAEAAFALGMDAAEAKATAWREIRTPDGWPTLPV